MSKYYIYLITNLINGKIYVGKTNKPSYRWTQHKKVAKGGSEKYPNEYYVIHKAIKKYGKDNFKFEIIEEFAMEDEAYFFEEWWIEFLNSKNVNIGYNLNSGGKGGLKPSPTTIIKKSLAMLGKKVSKETKEKLSILNTGSNNPNYGLKRSTDTLSKMSKKQRGENNPQAKATEQQILQIRQEYETGKYTYKDIAIKFGLKKDNAYRIITRKIWRHI
jgi:group I intron endonuclease